MKHPVRRLTLEALEDRRLLATCHVVRLGDVGDGYNPGGGHSRGDLRYCINLANDVPGPDVIDITATGTINLKSPLPVLRHELIIDGPGADQLTIRRDTAGHYRIFTILSGAHVEIYNVAVTNGSEQMGGGIRNDGVLTLGASAVFGNTVFGSTAGLGGGIYNHGALTIVDSTISGNNSFGSPAVGGGVFNTQSGTLAITNSTISGNKVESFTTPAVAIGGGIANTGQLTIIHSTITRNSAISHASNQNNGQAEGGGVLGSANANNTIVSGNSVAGPSGNTQCPDICFNPGGYNVIGGDAKLGPLQYNGGRTQTHALLPGSPAIDAGDPNPVDPPEFDQRGPGFPRIVNGRIDIGAFEVQTPGLPPHDNFLAILITADLESKT
jgi:hypothetical protein